MSNRSATARLAPNETPQPPSRSHSMRELGRRTDMIKETIPEGASVGFVDYPMHINVGDLLIMQGAMHFFRTNGNPVPTSFCLFDESPRHYRKLEECDVIACHGGGNFGDIYPKHQQLRERIVAHFHAKPIVVMPQSFHFSGAAAMKDSARIFRKHDNVTIYVRDQESYETARAHFSDQVFLCPDMAHRLYDDFAPVRERARLATPTDAPLRLIRRDVEATGDERLENRDAVDWTDILTTTEKARIWRYRAGARLDGVFSMNTPQRLMDYSSTLTSIISDVAARLIVHDDWTTSRLHGAIFGLLLDRNVTLFDNSYGKNSRYFTVWGDGALNVDLRPVTG